MTFHQFAFRNVFRNFRVYAAFFLASFFSVLVFFIYSMLMLHPEIDTGFLGEVPILGMVLAEFILVAFSWFFIFYSLRAFLQARSKEFGILLQLGMERGQLAKLIVFETIIIGFVSIVIGMIFGFAFSKFFFMIVREILNLADLPMYFAWKPFALTFIVFMSAFIIIALVSVLFTQDTRLIDQLKGRRYVDVSSTYSKKFGMLGIVLIGLGYLMALTVSKSTMLIILMVTPILIVFGTYYFFSDSLLMLFDIVKRRKHYYWKKFRILSIAEQVAIARNNSRIFFVVTLVSTLAFLCIGMLSALSSYTSQYNKINPLGMIYKGHLDNPYEGQHINSLLYELEENELSYHMSRFTVLRQTSSTTSNIVEVFRESDINHMLFAYGYPMVRLSDGEAMFIGDSEETIAQFEKLNVETTLIESNVPIQINSVYPLPIFPAGIIGQNAIIIKDEQFVLLNNMLDESLNLQPGYHLFTFDIPNWMATEYIGVDIYNMMSSEYVYKDEYSLPFYFENTGLNYSYIISTYSLFTLVGILVVAVFLLAGGSFVYFQLYTNLDQEKKQFEVLNRLGLTAIEMKKIVTRRIIMQFFLPWGVALLHSIFAFFALQSILTDVWNISIVKEVVLSFSVFFVLQIVYFYLIRWRYLVHVIH